MIALVYINCHQKKEPKQAGYQSVFTEKNIKTPKAIKLLTGVFLQKSYLSLNGDSLTIIDSYFFDTTSPHSKNIFYYDNARKEFHYTNSVIKATSPSSFQTLQGKNLLSEVLTVNKRDLDDYYKTNKTSFLPANALRKDIRPKWFNNKYYVVNGVLPEFIYIIDPLKKTTDSLHLTGPAVDAINIAVHDFDKDGSPELLLFHKKMLLRDEMTGYTIYSIRNDSIPVIIGPAKSR